MKAIPRLYKTLTKNPHRDWLILFFLWLLAAIADRTWFAFDRSIPGWDQADHLTRSLNYWRVIREAQPYSGQWWTELWQQSSTYRAPFFYLATVPFFLLFGTGEDQATLVNLVFTALLLVATYLLGKRCFNRATGLWAAGLALLSPQLVYARTDYLLDYGLTALVTIVFLCLTYWRDCPVRLGWVWSLWGGLALGLTLLTKPTGFIYFLVPGFWVLGASLLWRQWLRGVQFLLAAVLSWLVIAPWFTTNWLTILTSMGQSNSVGAIEGDPTAATLEGWLYYWKHLPGVISWPLLVSAVGIGLLALGTRLTNRPLISPIRSPFNTQQSGWGWLLGFCLGAYGVCTLATNKDIRFFLPCVPVLLILFSWALVQFSNRWFSSLRWAAVTATIGWLLLNLIPLPVPPGLGGWHLLAFTPQFPIEPIIQKIVSEEPFLQSTLGMLVDFKHLNAFNIDYYGALANFQVYGRQLALSQDFVPQDTRSLSWYLTKTGEQGSFTGNEPIATLRDLVDQSPDLEKVQTWPLANSSELRLYHRREPAVTVQPLSEASDDPIRLDEVQVPAIAPPGKPIPVTYQVSGSQEALQNGLLILTWQHSDQSQTVWFHDHGIGLGQLRLLNTTTAQYQITERMAMLPPENLPPGRYILNATYLNRMTGESFPLPLPPVGLMLDPNAKPIPAPELDLITQLRQLAKNLPVGKLDPVFNQVGRINQYDPVQDYLIQAERILAYRLQTNPTDLPSTYTLTLAHILRRQAIPAIDALTQITYLDRTNPYAWAYLAFVHLYRWQPYQAERALKQVEALNPRLPELRTLQIVTAIMKLDLPLVWKLLS